MRCGDISERSGLRRRPADPAAIPRAARGGSGGAGASVKITSGWPSMVWKLGGSRASGAAMDSVRSRISACDVGSSAGRDLGRRASASISAGWRVPAAEAARRGRWRRRRQAAGRGGGGRRRLGRPGGLAVSSSAMMRRMEARISSIEGSCAFADWLIAAIPHTFARDRHRIRPPAANRHAASHNIYTGSPQVWHVGRTQTAVWIRTSRDSAADWPVICRPACARRPRCRAPDDNASRGS